MDPLKLLEFQINGLGYCFKNVDLLQEALTHSLDADDESPDFPNQNWTFKRLQCLGNAVIKFAVSQFVIQSSDKSCDEGKLTAKKDSVINGTIQKKVGEKLFEPYERTRGNLFNYVRVGRSFKNNYYRSNQVLPYEKLVRALMGAVYLDGGGISGDGMQMAYTVFLKIWREHLNLKDLRIEGTENILGWFPSPSKLILEFWKRKGVVKNFIDKVKQSIGANVTKDYLLVEALIQKTFYDGSSFPQEPYLPDYQRLEFLGDSVLGLVVTELLWKNYPHDDGVSASLKPLDHQITGKISGDAQLNIFRKLGLAKFVRMKPGGIPGWSMQDDLVESIVGAIFVDGGGVAVKDFIVKTWNIPISNQQSGLDDLQDKLGYKFQNKQFLIRALSHPDTSNVNSGRSELYTERSQKLRQVLKYFGTSWIQFHATEYVLRTSNDDDSLASLVFRRNYLCSEQVLLRIASNMNLSKHISLSMDQQNRGLEPYMLYENIIQAIVGAIFKDMQEAGVKMSFGKVFYRLWNPFLRKCPKESLLQNFPSSATSSIGAIEDWQITDIEENLLYSFSNQHLLEQAIMKSHLGGKFSFLGESILDLAIRVYVAILCYMHLQDPDNDNIPPRLLDVNLMHARTLSKCLDFAEELYELEDIREYSNHHIRGGLPVSDDELTKRIFGAIFVDMDQKSADIGFSEWKQYFMLHRKFITGLINKEREE